MGRIRRILAATDFSAHSAHAETRAAMLCEELKCWALELVTVNDPELLDPISHALNTRITAARAALAEKSMSDLGRVARRLEDVYRVRCMPVVRFGRPAAEIIARADEVKADLLVIGAHGNSYCGDLFLGNQADKLVRMSTRPLLIVKNQPQRAYREVVIAVDFSDDSLRAAELALQLAPDAHITFLHAFRDWPDAQVGESVVSRDIISECRVQAANHARQRLDEFIAGLGAISQPLSTVVQPGLPAQTISSYADIIHPDLIAMGKHGGSRLQELLIGSVTHRATNRAPCDVLVATHAQAAREWHEPSAA